MSADELAQDDAVADSDLVLLREISVTRCKGMAISDGDLVAGEFVCLRLGGVLNHTAEVREQAYVVENAAQLGATVQGLVEAGVATYGRRWAHILAGALVEILDVE